MPTLTRWYIRTAFAWLVTALAIGVALQAGIVAPGVRAQVWPAYLHLITLGWLTGLIFGVAWWLSRAPPGRVRTTLRMDGPRTSC